MGPIRAFWSNEEMLKYLLIDRRLLLSIVLTFTISNCQRQLVAESSQRGRKVARRKAAIRRT